MFVREAKIFRGSGGGSGHQRRPAAGAAASSSSPSTNENESDGKSSPDNRHDHHHVSKQQKQQRQRYYYRYALFLVTTFAVVAVVAFVAALGGSYRQTGDTAESLLRGDNVASVAPSKKKPQTTTNTTRQQQEQEQQEHVLLLVNRSITVPAIKSYVVDVDDKDGNGGKKEVIVVPAHFLAILDDQGECVLPGKSFCDDYRHAKQDLHVDQSIMSVLRNGRCHRHEGTTPGTPPSTTIRNRVWDLGSNIGYYTTFMRAMGCHVTAVEPQPSMNKIARDSVAANGWADDGSVVLHERLGVSDRPGQITLTKLWQPGNKNAGSMTIDTITIRELADETLPSGEVELVKLDIDGPELYTLRGIIDLNRTLLVKNMVVELSVGMWKRDFGFDDDSALEIFERYYDVGYRMFLIMESEFPKYPKKTLSQLRELRNFHELVHCYEIPREKIGEVLWMANKVTKNIFFSKDPLILSKL